MTVQPLYQRMLHLGLDTVQSRITRLISRAVLSSRGFTMLTGSSRKERGRFRSWIQGQTGLCQRLLQNPAKSTWAPYSVLNRLSSYYDISYTFHIQISHRFNTSCNELDLP